MKRYEQEKEGYLHSITAKNAVSYRGIVSVVSGKRKFLEIKIVSDMLVTSICEVQHRKQKNIRLTCKSEFHPIKVKDSSL